MTALKNELRLLRWNLLLLVICIGLSVGAGYVLREMGEKQAALTRAAQAKASQIQAETTRLRNEEQDIRNKIGMYQDIAARGILSPEKRLDWVDLIKSIRQQRKLLDVQYEIYPQSPLPSGLLTNVTASGHDFMASSMRVTIPLLHEEDLVHFISDLRNAAPAFIRVNECRINRVNRNTEKPDNPAQLLADCRLDWITVKPRMGNVQP